MVRIETIPAHIVYEREYDITNSFYDFFDEETGENQLYNFQLEMEADNPDVHVPDMPDDYNYFVFPAGTLPKVPVKTLYRDKVDKAGKPGNNYKFSEVPEVTVAVMEHWGSNDDQWKTYEKLYKWVEENGYEIAGDSRSSAIHGPWDAESVEGHMLELQVPIRRK